MLPLSSVQVDLLTGSLTGCNVVRQERRLRDLAGLYADTPALAALDQEQIVYRVEMHAAVAEGTPGGLFFGSSFLEPGRVGDEYFMTKGHFHANRDAAEYYWGVQGTGGLIIMDEAGHCWAEQVFSGSLHYIPGRVAHRLANTGNTTLVVGACWPADAGHDYAAIVERGFSARLREIDGRAQLVREGQP